MVVEGIIVRYYCPNCWKDFENDFQICPNCGVNLPVFLEGKDYVDNLIIALNHPERETPIRIAWILGRLRDERAVEPLINLLETTKDVYIACAAVKALGQLNTLRTRQYLSDIAVTHPAAMVRDEAGEALSQSVERVEKVR